MATEEIIMEHSRRGGDRQAAHEAIRESSQTVITAIREHGAVNDLFARLKASKEFAGMGAFIDSLTDAGKFVGRAPEQVAEFLSEVVDPLLNQHGRGKHGEAVEV
jgi:adenylosuccinate lyase